MQAGALDESKRKEFLGDCSRHKVSPPFVIMPATLRSNLSIKINEENYPIPSTPDDFWELSFADSIEERGYR